MAYNYLGLVNDVCGRVNETPLTSSNFAAAGDFYSNAKEAVNASIRYINQREFGWPWNHVVYNQLLTPGDNRYSYQPDAKVVDFDTFRIQRDNTLNTVTTHLMQISYEEYVQKGGIDMEYNTDTSIRSVPYLVAQGPKQEFVVYPSPDQAYTLTYEYEQLPVDLEDFNDVPSIPVSFRHIIVDGAMYYVYFFRGDIETADRLFQKYNDGIKNMQSIYINRFEFMRDTRI